MKKEIQIHNESIMEKIKIIRGQKIILDADLAALFGVETKRLKEQIRRNKERFPITFMFELTKEESNSLRNQNNKLEKGKYSKYTSFAFTEHGILMASNVLKSKVAIKISVQIIETFIELRKLASNYEELYEKMKEMETTYNHQFGEIYDVLQKLLSKPTEAPRKKIGYKNP